MKKVHVIFEEFKKKIKKKLKEKFFEMKAYVKLFLALLLVEGEGSYLLRKDIDLRLACCHEVEKKYHLIFTKVTNRLLKRSNIAYSFRDFFQDVLGIKIDPQRIFLQYCCFGFLIGALCGVLHVQNTQIVLHWLVAGALLFSLFFLWLAWDSYRQEKKYPSFIYRRNGRFKSFY